MLVTSLAILQPLYVAPVRASATQPNFQEQIVFQGLTKPTNMEFAPSAGDDRIFVAEKAGVVKVFDNLADTTPTIVANLSQRVHDQWDRGLLGLAISPTSPDIYVLYTYGVPLSGGAERDDKCTGTGAATNGKCVVSARLSRLTLNASGVMTAEHVLINDWCQQYPSHSIGDLKFGEDGYLYVSAGDGASFGAIDHGQLPIGGPINPCADPPGGGMSPPAAEGGSLRAQDLRTPGDPATLDGAILRLDPATGFAAPGNPLIASSQDVNARRIVAHGLRNPYHFAIRPGTNEVWIGDVGAAQWEEIDRVVDPTAGVTNFGWPCYEGDAKNTAFSNLGLYMCDGFYDVGVHTKPYFTYNHTADIVANEGCGAGGDAISGLAFHPAGEGSYPVKYRGALFFADYSRGCIWAMKPSTVGGLPAPGNIELFAKNVTAADLAFGPDGELYFVDHAGGSIRRFRYFPGNQPPVAVIAASSVSGGAPLTVEFDGTGSSDADPADASGLRYAWDFTNDGTTDATTPTASFTYSELGNHTAKLTVTDTLQITGTATISIHVGDDLPTATIDSPAQGFTWAVDQQITFTGHATDPGHDGALPKESLTWRLRMQHCTTLTTCHTHNMSEWVGESGGSFVAPDHEYPSYMELELDAEDADHNHSVVVRRLYPKTVDLTFVGSYKGVMLTVGEVTQATPFTRTVIQGASISVSAPSSQLLRTGRVMSTVNFLRWSDGLARSHVITAPTVAKCYTAVYKAVRARRIPAWGAGSTTVPGLRGRIPRRFGIL